MWFLIITVFAVNSEAPVVVSNLGEFYSQEACVSAAGSWSEKMRESEVRRQAYMKSNPRYHFATCAKK